MQMVKRQEDHHTRFRVDATPHRNPDTTEAAPDTGDLRHAARR